MPPLAAFNVEGASAIVRTVGISGATLQLTLRCCLDSDADLSLVYTPQATDELEDLTGNDVAAFTHPIDNRTVPGPAIESVVVQGRELRLTFGAELDGAWMVPADSFAVTTDGSGVAVESAAVEGNDVVVTLNEWVAGHYAVTITYTPSSDGALRAVGGGYVRAYRRADGRESKRSQDWSRLRRTERGSRWRSTRRCAVTLRRLVRSACPVRIVASVAMAAQAVVLTLSDALTEGQIVSHLVSAGGRAARCDRRRER